MLDAATRIEFIEKLVAAGADQVRVLIEGARRESRSVPLRFHFHNTRNTG